MIAFSGLALLLLLGALALIPLGLRAGDHAGDVLLLSVEPHVAPRGAAVTITNPDHTPVILGMSLRSAGLRLRLESGTYVRLRTGSTAPELRADRQARVVVLDAGETRRFVLPADPRLGRRAELVTVVGQHDRLRTVHRLVELPRPDLRREYARDQLREAGLEPLER